MAGRRAGPVRLQVRQPFAGRGRPALFQPEEVDLQIRRHAPREVGLVVPDGGGHTVSDPVGVIPVVGGQVFRDPTTVAPTMSLTATGVRCESPSQPYPSTGSSVAASTSRAVSSLGVLAWR